MHWQILSILTIREKANLQGDRKRWWENRKLIKSLKIANEKLQNELSMMSEELELIKNIERDHINMD